MYTILEEFLELKKILKSFDGLEKKYNWLLTDLDWYCPEDCIHYFADDRIFNSNSDRLNTYWITGENLTKLANVQNVYFIWGVFSAFYKEEIIDLDTIKPYADGNPNFWVKNPKIQHPKAVVELVLWDSSSILLLSKDDEITNTFRNSFKGWQDLNNYN